MKFIVPLSLLTLSAAAIDDGVIDPFIKFNNLRSRGLVPGKGNNGTLFPSHSLHLYDVLSQDVHNIWNTLLTNLIYNMMWYVFFHTINTSDNKVTVIVTLEKELDSSGRALKDTQGLLNKCEKLAEGKGGSNKYVYSNVLNGCAMEIPRQKMASLMEEPGVKAVEEDVIVTASQITTANP